MAKERNIFCGYCEFAENCEKHFFECDKHKIFAEIAKDQRKIDIEKACKWLEDNGWRFHNGDYKDTIEDFRKAMED